MGMELQHAISADLVQQNQEILKKLDEVGGAQVKCIGVCPIHHDSMLPFKLLRHWQ